MMRRALITGIGGQDGSYLADLLVESGYEVHGIELPGAPLVNLVQLAGRITLHHGSLLEADWLRSIVKSVSPGECYHLAASSFVSYRFEDETQILENNIGGTHNLLAALLEFAPGCRLFFAGTSEMFGTVEQIPQDEWTPFRPHSIYGLSKVAGHHLVEYYRQNHGLFACTGILFNHESPRRGMAFVTRKITSAAARISRGLESKLILGNLDAERDWGYAPDYVRAMPLMLAARQPCDYVLATGTLHTVRDFVEAAFSVVNLDYRDYVEISAEFYREKEAVPLCGDARRIASALGWRAERRFDEIVREMVTADLARLEGKAG